MFKKDQTTVAVFRQDSVDDNWYKKSGYKDTGNTYKGHLKAQTVDRTEELGAFGKVYVFHTSDTADIQEWDRLKANWVDYDVKWVSDFNGISFQRKQVLLNKA